MSGSSRMKVKNLLIYSKSKISGNAVTDWDDMSFVQVGGETHHDGKFGIPMNFICSAITGKKTWLPKLLVQCKFHSCCRIRKKIYVFGGHQVIL